MNLESASVSRRGAERHRNEDALLDDPERGHFAVADGLGGSPHGELASRVAIEMLQTGLSGLPAEPEAEAAVGALRSSFERVNEVLLAVRANCGHKAETTLTAAVLCGGLLALGHVGDSRLYLLDREGLAQLTEDQTLVGQMLRGGLLSETEARGHPRRSVLSGCLGQHEKFKLQSVSCRLASGQALVLCTDGVSDVLGEAEIAECVRADLAADASVRLLLEAALAAGSPDDVSAIVVKLA
ncbi:MAG: PP2C family protein-serine/threonine phosphatase [Planctomycetota bacterium]|jgi:protein phosphatase